MCACVPKLSKGETERGLYHDHPPLGAFSLSLPLPPLLSACALLQNKEEGEGEEERKGKGRRRGRGREEGREGKGRGGFTLIFNILIFRTLAKLFLNLLSYILTDNISKAKTVYSYT